MIENRASRSTECPGFGYLRLVALAVTAKVQNEMKRNELYACRDKLVGPTSLSTTLQVVFNGRQDISPA